MSSNNTIDGKNMSLISALDIAVGDGFPSLISCVSGKFAYFEAEQSYGLPARFILTG